MRTKTETRFTLAVPADLTEAAIGRFLARLRDLLRETPPVVHFDCSGLEHVTSSYVHVFWQAYERCQNAGAKIRLVSPSGGLLRTLRILDLAEFFGVGDVASPRDGPQDPSEFVNTAGVYTDRFRADVEGINRAADRFVRFLARVQVGQTMMFELRTVFYEEATNIRRHGQLTMRA